MHHSTRQLQGTATHCNTLQHTATHCHTLQHTATQRVRRSCLCASLDSCTATHFNALQHTATHCNTLCQLLVLACIADSCTTTHSSALQHTAMHSANCVCLRGSLDSIVPTVVCLRHYDDLKQQVVRAPSCGRSWMFAPTRLVGDRGPASETVD